MRWYFDTSAINHLHDDSAWDSVALEAFVKTQQLWISTLNIAEVAVTPDETRRVSLLRLTKTLANGVYPLALPGDILRWSLEKFFEPSKQADSSLILPTGMFYHKDHSMSWSIDNRDAGFWEILQNPESVNDDDVSCLMGFKNDEGDWYRDFVESGRESIQRIREAEGDKQERWRVDQVLLWAGGQLPGRALPRDIREVRLVG